jgi:GTPase SAR1 family protein
MISQWALLCTKGILLRAALVSRNGKGAIIIGKSGSGKTSLASSLILSGWSYHGDQLVFIANDELICESLALPLFFNDDWKLPAYEGILSDINATEYNGKTILSVSDLLPDCVSDNKSVVPEFLVVSHFESGSSLALTPLRAGLAAFHLINSILNKNNFSQSGLSKIGQIIKVLLSFELVFGDFEQLSSLNLLFSECDDLKSP